MGHGGCFDGCSCVVLMQCLGMSSYPKSNIDGLMDPRVIDALFHVVLSTACRAPSYISCPRS